MATQVPPLSFSELSYTITSTAFPTPAQTPNVDGTPIPQVPSAGPSIIYSVSTYTVELIDLSPAQTSLYYSELDAYETGSEYLSLGSKLRAELPGSVFDVETTGGFAALSSEYGTAFTEQPWYSYVIDVHTRVEDAIQSINEAVASQSIVASPSTTHTTSSMAVATSTSSPTLAPSKSHSNTTTLALGVALGAFALLVLGGLVTFCLVRRRKRRRSAAGIVSSDDVPEGNGIATISDAKGVHEAAINSDLPTHGHGIEVMRELDGYGISGELQGEGSHVYELGDGRLSKNTRR